MNLGKLRKKRGLSQKQLAEAVGVSRGLISRVENGWERPYESLRQRIAEALDVDEKELFR